MAIRSSLFVLAAGVLAGCETQHQVNTTSAVEVKPIRIETVHEVKPIHITVEVRLKAEQALNDFFGDLDAQSAVLKPPAP